MRNRRRRKGFPIERDRGNRVGAPLCAFLALLALISIARAGVIEQKYPDDKAVKSRYTVVADGKKSGPYWRYLARAKSFTPMAKSKPAKPTAPASFTA